jgi:hypothetical protein
MVSLAGVFLFETATKSERSCMVVDHYTNGVLFCGLHPATLVVLRGGMRGARCFQMISSIECYGCGKGWHLGALTAGRKMVGGLALR